MHVREMGIRGKLPGARLSAADETALRILARSIVSELGKYEYGFRHIIALAGELIGLACESIRSGRTPPDGA